MGEKAWEMGDVGICPVTGRFVHADAARDKGEEIQSPDESFKQSTDPSFFDCIAA
jgi:hypothetical protein